MRIGLIAAGVAGVLCVVAAALLLFLPGGRHYHLTAEFTDASGLTSGFTVERDGVTVGRITGVRVSRSDHALVSFDLNRGAYPIGSRAQFVIRPSNLLGERYVDIENPNAGTPMRSGTVISDARTSTPAQLNEVIDMLNLPTRVALGEFLEETGAAVVGRGQDLARILRNLPQTLPAAQQTLGDLDSDNSALERLLYNSEVTLHAVEPQRAQLQRLIVNADSTFAATASSQQDLASTIRDAGPTVAQVNASLVKLHRAAGPLALAAKGLRATAKPLTATLRAAPAFVNEAIPTITEAGRVAPALSRILHLAAPVLTQILPTADKLVSVAQTLAPVSTNLLGSWPNILAALQAVGQATQDSDAAGHYIRGAPTAGSDVLYELSQLSNSQTTTTSAGTSTSTADTHPSTPTQTHSQTAGTPSTSTPLGSLQSSISNVTSSIGGVVQKVAGAVSPGSSTSGQSTGPLSSLLNYLVKP